MRILLADDSMTAQNMGKKILADAGYEVITVSNGAAAVKKIAESAPDLAILDVYMPGYTGLEVCERLKGSPATGRIPVLLTVGKMEPFRPEDGTKVKADGVIIKPFEATDLISLVEKLSDRMQATTPPERLAPVAPAAVKEAEPEPPKEEPASDEADADIPFGTAEAALQRFEAADESDDVSAAAELQTFAASADLSVPSQPETALELTSAPPVDVEGKSLAGLEPTIGSQSAEFDTTMERLLDSFGGDSEDEPVESSAVTEPLVDESAGFSDSFTAGASDMLKAADLPDDEFGGDDPKNTGAHNWVAVEEQPDEEEVKLNLHAEMLAAGDAHKQNWDGNEDTLQPSDQSRKHTSANEPLGPEVASNLIAPLGKTSLDELDSVIEETSARFEAATAAADAADNQTTALLSDDLVTPDPLVSVDPFSGSEPVATDAVPEETAEIAAAETLHEPMLEVLSEERESEPAFTAPSLTGSDSLSGVFDIEASENHGSDVPENKQEPAVTLIPEGNEAVEVAESASEGADVESLGALDPVLPVEDFEADLRGAGSSAMKEESQRVSIDPTAKLVAAPIEEPDGIESDLRADASAEDSTLTNEKTVNVVVERVVERVLDRLKPILSAMVEEILHELKRPSN